MATINKLREKQDRIVGSINREQKRFETMVKKNKETEKVFIKTQKDLVAVEKQVDLFEKKLVDSQEEVKEVSLIISTKDRVVKDLEEKIRIAEEDLINAVEERQEEDIRIQGIKNSFIKSKQKVEAKFNAEILTLEEERAGLMEGNKTIAEGTKNLEQINNETETELAKLNVDISEEERTLEKVKNDTANAEQKLKERKEDIKDLDEEIKDLKSVKAGAEKVAKLAIKDSEIEKGRLEKLVKERLSIAQKKEELDSYKAELKRLYKQAGMDFPLA